MYTHLLAFRMWPKQWRVHFSFRFELSAEVYSWSEWHDVWYILWGLVNWKRGFVYAAVACWFRIV